MLVTADEMNATEVGLRLNSLFNQLHNPELNHAIQGIAFSRPMDVIRKEGYVNRA